MLSGAEKTDVGSLWILRVDRVFQMAPKVVHQHRGCPQSLGTPNAACALAIDGFYGKTWFLAFTDMFGKKTNANTFQFVAAA